MSSEQAVVHHAGRGASRGRGKGRGAGRGRKRLRSVSDSDHDRSIEAESSPEPFEEEEEDDDIDDLLDSEQQRAASVPASDVRGPVKKRKVSVGGKQAKSGRSRTDSGQTELSEDEDDVGDDRKTGHPAASPRTEDTEEDATAGASATPLTQDLNSTISSVQSNLTQNPDFA
jgi:hypothetical protein